MKYLRIKNFEKYQHYTTRNPPWIKLYKSLLTDHSFLRLDVNARYLYICLLILASETDNKVVNDPSFIAQRAFISPSDVNLLPLFRSGFLLASEASTRRVEKRQRRVEESRAATDAPTTLALVEPPQKRERKPETEWPEGFQWNGKHKAIADGLGLNVQMEFVKFHDKALSKGYRYKDWDAGFRTWLNNAFEFKQRRP